MVFLGYRVVWYGEYKEVKMYFLENLVIKVVRLIFEWLVFKMIVLKEFRKFRFGVGWY